MSNQNITRIPPFKEYWAAKKQQKLNEENTPNIKVEVEWWNDAIDLVLRQIHSVAGEPIDWGTLVDYCRAKFLVLNREVPMVVEELVQAHIRDLVFQYFGEAIFNSNDPSLSSYQSSELGTKILAVSQVSGEILRIVKVESGLETKPEPEEESPNTVASVALDKCYYAEDDLPYENRVCKFWDFNKKIDEAYCTLQFDHYNTVLNKCLKDLESFSEGGNIIFGKVLKKAKELYDCKNATECIDKYLTKIARKHMAGEEIKVQDVDLKDSNVTDEGVWKSARNLFVYNIVEDLRGRLVSNA